MACYSVCCVCVVSLTSHLYNSQSLITSSIIRMFSHNDVMLRHHAAAMIMLCTIQEHDRLRQLRQHSYTVLHCTEPVYQTADSVGNKQHVVHFQTTDTRLHTLQSSLLLPTATTICVVASVDSANVQRTRRIHTVCVSITALHQHSCRHHTNRSLP